MSTRFYDTDLTDAAWAFVAPVLPAARPGGRPRTTKLRAVLNAIFYLLRTGCQWRLLPKAFGQIPKSLFILQVIDDPVLRQAIEKQMDRIEHVHCFTRAVSVGNPREFLQAEKEDQEMAEACKRLIKNCIICWNYLYLSQKLEEITDTESREALLDAVAHGSTVAWRHLNLLGEYDFSDEKLQDTVGIKPPKLADQRETFLGPAKRTELPGR